MQPCESETDNESRKQLGSSQPSTALSTPLVRCSFPQRDGKKLGQAWHRLLAFSRTALALGVAVVGGMVSAGAEQPRARTVRSLHHSGLYYPKPPALKAYLEQVLGPENQARARIPAEKSVVALAPQGSYSHCGASLATLFGALARYRFDHIMLIGARHKPLKGISVYWAGPGSAWTNPLDSTEALPIDPIGSTLARQFHKPGATPEEEHWGEHSLEILVPFLAWTHPGQSWSAILINDLDQVDFLVRGLKETFRGQRVLYLISASFSRGLVPAQAEKQDVQTMGLLRGKPSALLAALRSVPQMTDSPAPIYAAHRLQHELDLPPFFWTDYRQSLSIEKGMAQKDSVSGRGYLSGWTRFAQEKLSPRMGQALLSVARHAVAKALGHVIPPKDPAAKDLANWPPTYGIGLTVGGQGGPSYDGLFLSAAGPITNLPRALSTFAQAFVRWHRNQLHAVHPGQMRVELFVVPYRPRLLMRDGIVPYQDSAAVVRSGQVVTFERRYWKEGRSRSAYLQHLARKLARSHHPLASSNSLPHPKDVTDRSSPPGLRPDAQAPSQPRTTPTQSWMPGDQIWLFQAEDVRGTETLFSR